MRRLQARQAVTTAQRRAGRKVVMVMRADGIFDARIGIVESAARPGRCSSSGRGIVHGDIAVVIADGVCGWRRAGDHGRAGHILGA